MEEVVNEWQPIETAPKGTPVLLFERRGAMKRRYNLNSSSLSVGGEFFVGRFSQYWNEWQSMPGDYRRCPTHWQPLPAPPDAARTTAFPPEGFVRPEDGGEAW